ncbi:MAG TPA: signal peptidase I [Candidatus Limnocylindrales bacterium]
MVRRGAFGCAIEIVQTLVLTVLIFVGIQAFVAQPYRVQQGSMETTLMPDQYVLVDKLTPRFGGYHRGDIIVFDPPATVVDEGDTPFIKRIVALPGENVAIDDGRVFVDGNPLDEPYLFAGQPTQAGGSRHSWTVPDGDVFVLGDHRQASSDSRVFGPIAESSIIGRAWLRYWPLSLFGVLPTPTYDEAS